MLAIEGLWRPLDDRTMKEKIEKKREGGKERNKRRERPESPPAFIGSKQGLLVATGGLESSLFQTNRSHERGFQPSNSHHQPLPPIFLSISFHLFGLGHRSNALGKPPRVIVGLFLSFSSPLSLSSPFSSSLPLFSPAFQIKRSNHTDRQPVQFGMPRTG